MGKRIYAYSRATKHAAGLLGSEIRQARIRRRWTVRELAERVGVSTNTLHKVERGDPTVQLGTAFDAAAILGVPLFYEDRARLAAEVSRGRDRVALLPKRVHREEVDDDF